MHSTRNFKIQKQPQKMNSLKFLSGTSLRTLGSVSPLGSYRIRKQLSKIITETVDVQKFVVKDKNRRPSIHPKVDDGLLNTHQDFIVITKESEFKKGTPILKLKQDDFESKITYVKKPVQLLYKKPVPTSPSVSVSASAGSISSVKSRSVAKVKLPKIATSKEVLSGKPKRKNRRVLCLSESIPDINVEIKARKQLKEELMEMYKKYKRKPFK